MVQSGDPSLEKLQDSGWRNCATNRRKTRNVLLADEQFLREHSNPSSDDVSRNQPSPRAGGRGARRRALVGAQQHLVLGAALGATPLLLCQELLEPAGGEAERLPPQPHQVGVLQPGLREAVPRGGTGPGGDTQRQRDTLGLLLVRLRREAPHAVLPALTTRNCSASS